MLAHPLCLRRDRPFKMLETLVALLVMHELPCRSPNT